MTDVDWVDVLHEKPQRCNNKINKVLPKRKGLVLFNYCIMSNYIHIIVNTNEPFLLKDKVRAYNKTVLVD